MTGLWFQPIRNCQGMPRGHLCAQRKYGYGWAFACIYHPCVYSLEGPMEKCFQLGIFIGRRLNAMYRNLRSVFFVQHHFSHSLTIINHYQPARSTVHFFSMRWSAPKTAMSGATTLCAAPAWPPRISHASFGFVPQWFGHSWPVPKVLRSGTRPLSW